MSNQVDLTNPVVAIGSATVGTDAMLGGYTRRHLIEEGRIYDSSADFVQQ